MNWAHLPVAGGIYDQHPQLIDDWLIMFQAQSRKQQQEQAKAKAEQEAAKAKGRRGRR